MKLYTRGGDTGETSLFDGTRVAKDDIRVAAYGEVDELNAVLGWCAAGGDLFKQRIVEIQEDLFVVGSELATPPDSPAAGKIPMLAADRAAHLEGWIDQACSSVPPLRHFVLPGGTELASRLHVARTCCRRAERAVVTLARSTALRSEVIIYLNRLGDLLFAWARQANGEAGCPDVLWVPQR